MHSFFLVATLLISALFSLQSEQKDKTVPCFFEHDTWQLYSYRNNINGSDTSRPRDSIYSYGFNIVIQFRHELGDSIHIFRGHSLSNTIQGKYIYSNNLLEIKSFGNLSAVRELPWGTDSLKTVFHKYSSYDCIGDSLYINYRDDTQTAVFSKANGLDSLYNVMMWGSN